MRGVCERELKVETGNFEQLKIAPDTIVIFFVTRDMVNTNKHTFHLTFKTFFIVGRTEGCKMQIFNL